MKENHRFGLKAPSSNFPEKISILEFFSISKSNAPGLIFLGFLRDQPGDLFPLLTTKLSPPPRSSPTNKLGYINSGGDSRSIGMFWLDVGVFSQHFWLIYLHGANPSRSVVLGGQFSLVLLRCRNAFRIVRHPRKRPVMSSSDVFFYVALNKLLNTQSRCRWFEKPWRSCDVTVMALQFKVQLHTIWCCSLNTFDNFY